MNYRDLGNTGLRVSEIGMGCEGFSKNEYQMTSSLISALSGRTGSTSAHGKSER